MAVENLDLPRLCSSTSTLCREVSYFIKEHLHEVSKDQIEAKSLNSLVSYVDKEAEKQLITGLRNLLPEAGFITEENTVQQKHRELTWVIDPLDGTTNYLYKIPHFSISVALTAKSKPIMGCVFEVMQDKSFTAIRGMGAWEDGQKIQVNTSSDKTRAMVVTGFPYKRDLDLEARLDLFRECILQFRGIRRLGSAALDLAYVASGRFDIYYENTLNIWDVAAGALLVEEAGGKVSDFKGGDGYCNDGSIIASNPALYPEFMSLLARYL